MKKGWQALAGKLDGNRSGSADAQLCVCPGPSPAAIDSSASTPGAILTFFLIPDLTGLDLKEGDKRWLAILAGDEYDGPV